MKMKYILLLALFLIAGGCSIIEDDYLKDLPEDIRPRRIDLEFRKIVIDVSDEYKVISAEIAYTGNQVMINWPSGVNVFFFNKDATKTVYQLNPNGFAEKITTTFADGTIMEDVLTYNANQQVVELTNSFFKDNLKLYYKNNVLDSVVKTRTINSVTQRGFFKRVNAYAIISIFPYDNTKPYDLTFSTGMGCSSGSSLPVNINTFNKTEYLNIAYESDYVGLDRSLTINYKVNTTASNYFEKYFDDRIYGYTNYFKLPSYYYFYFSSCSGSYGNVNDGYLNLYRLLPTLVPDFLLLYQLTAENELEWIDKNAGKDYGEWFLQEIDYKYEPDLK